MKFTFQCPECHGQFSGARLFMKFSKLFFFCPNCRSSLKTKGIGIYLFFILAAVGMVSVLYLQRQVQLGQQLSLLLPILLIILYEIIAVLMVCNKAQIIVKRKRTRNRIKKTETQ